MRLRRTLEQPDRGKDAAAGAAALIATGIGTSQALAAAVAVGGLGVLSGAAVVLVAVVWRTGLLLGTTRVRFA